MCQIASQTDINIFIWIENIWIANTVSRSKFDLDRSCPLEKALNVYNYYLILFKLCKNRFKSTIFRSYVVQIWLMISSISITESSCNSFTSYLTSISSLTIEIFHLLSFETGAYSSFLVTLFVRHSYLFIFTRIWMYRMFLPQRRAR